MFTLEKCVTHLLSFGSFSIAYFNEIQNEYLEPDFQDTCTIY